MKFDKKINTLFLDNDGVLADFDQGFIDRFGALPESYNKEHGDKAFWDKIEQCGDFFIKLNPMPDCFVLYNAVKHLNPIILTGIPKNMNPSECQKIQWVEKIFGKDQKVICCRASRKFEYCSPGDILIDDRPKYKYKWDNAGGTFIVHTSAKNSIDKLIEMGVLNSHDIFSKINEKRKEIYDKHYQVDYEWEIK